MKLDFIKENNNKHLVIFVHGLNGGEKTFYNPIQSEYFYDHLNAKILNNIDIALLTYHSEIVSKHTMESWLNRLRIYNLSIDELSINAVNTIERVHTNYDSINYICHSMGGLIIKGALINSKILQNKIKFYFTLATPHRGTNKKTKISSFNSLVIRWNRQIKGLTESSDVISSLTYKYLTIQDKFDTFYYWASEDTWVLPKDNAIPVDEISKSLPVICTHEGISKPTTNFNYLHFINDINKRIEKALGLNDLKNNHIINENHIEKKLDSLETKINTLLENLHLSSNTNSQPIKNSENLNTEFINVPTGYIVKDAIMYKSNYYILLTKYDRSENIVTKYIANNDIDINFANNGIFEIVLNSNNSNMNRLLINDDHLFVVGESVQHNNFNILLCKLSLDGTLIENFHNNGYSIIGKDNTHMYANDAIFLNNGNIITCGANFQSKKILITSIDKNGNLSKDFGVNGIIEDTYSNENNWAQCICKYDETSFLVAGRANDWEIFISKFKNTGEKALDHFSTDGTAIYKHFLRVEDLKVQSSGKILIAGVGNEGRVIRLLSNGQIDSSFATDGVLEVITNERSEVLTLELFDDDTFVIGGFEYDGNSYHNAIFACYTEDGKLNTSVIQNGFKSFQITNKTTLHKIFIHSKKELSLLCNYNVDYSQNSRTKTSITNFLLNCDNNQDY